MFQALQELIYDSDIALYAPVGDHSRTTPESEHKSFLQITEHDVVSISVDECADIIPINGYNFSNSRSYKDHDFCAEELDDSQLHELVYVKLTPQAIEDFDCVEVQAALDASDFNVSVFIDMHLESIAPELQKFVQKHQSQPLRTYVSVAVTGDDNALLETSVQFICAEITFSVNGTTVRLLDHNGDDGYWYLSEPTEFEFLK